MFKLKMILSKVRFFSSIFICLALISCGNLFEDDISEKEEAKEKAKIEQTSSDNQIISKIPYLPGQTFILTGSMILDGAMPSFNSENRAALSRAALPELSASEVEYFVYAKDSDDNKVDGSFGEGENSKTFSIPLIFDKQWTVTCGMRKKTGSQEEFLTATSTPKTYTSENYTDPLVLYPQPATDGEGEISLSMTVPSTISNVSVECVSANKNDWENISVTKTTEAGATAVLIKSDDSEKIKSGVYKIKLGFYTGSELVYQITQSINVFYGMKTNQWYDAGGAGSSSPIQSDGSFQLTETNLKQFKATNFYVGPSAATGAAAPADTNSGTHKAPFETLERALNQIKEYGLETNDYKIHISGSLTPTAGAGFKIDSDFDDKMKSLTLIGVSSKTTDIISGNETYCVLQITTSKKVMIKDLTITKGSNTKGGGIYYYGTGKLVIDNCIIKENAASQSGGAIYSSGTVEVHSTDITNNSTQALGDAIFLLNGTYTMFGGEVSANTTSADDSGTIFVQKNATFILDSGEIKNNTSRAIYNHGIVEIENGTISGHTTAKKGAGIYNNGSVTINGGTISGNTSDENGGGIYVNGVTESATPSLTINGGTISGNSSASYGGGICNSSTLTITGGEISGNQSTGTSESAGGAIASFVDFTLGSEAYIPAGTEGKNDIYLYDSGDNVSKFHILLSSSLAKHDSTDKIKLTPAVYAEARPMIALAPSSTADLTVEYEKFSVSTDPVYPAMNWNVGTDGNLMYTISLLNVTTNTAEFNGSTAISSSPVFISGRNLGSIKSLIVSDHETTQGEYELYCKYGGSAPSDTYGDGEFYPAYYVSWYDAIVYCNLRSMADHLNPVYSVGGKTDPTKWAGIVGNSTTGYCASSDCDWYVVTDDTKNGWRLPYEAEWEYFWREENLENTNQHTYCGDDDPDAVAWYTPNSSSKAHLVKTKKANSLGIYDMCGNVWEWMNDWHSWPILAATPITGVSYENADPKNPVTRGGGWRSGTTESANAITASGARNNSVCNARFNDLGFRVVRNAAETTQAYPRAVSTTYIGTKTPSEVREVFDIIFTDGSAIPYTENLELTDEQKAAAIAVIFYKGNDLNKADDTSVRILGVGLVKQKNLPWAGETASAIAKNISDIQGAVNSGDKYGKDNLQTVSAFLTGAHDEGESITDDTVADETGKINNYPVFDFAFNYKTKATVLADTSFATDWYIPTISELNALGNEIVTVNAAILLCGKDTFSGSFWSSNQNHKGYNSNANNLTIIPGQSSNMTPNGTTMTNGFQMWTCAIHEF